MKVQILDDSYTYRAVIQGNSFGDQTIIYQRHGKDGLEYLQCLVNEEGSHFSPDQIQEYFTREVLKQWGEL